MSKKINFGWNDTIRKLVGNYKKESIKAMAKKAYQCPYDNEGRQCRHLNTLTMCLDIKCEDCDWYNDGIRPSKI